jgi:hypothetical protein
MVECKILSYKSPQRYAMRRTVQSAQAELARNGRPVELTIVEIKDLDAILAYTQVVILPSLVVNGRLVCVGRFPRKEEVLAWLSEA